MFKRLLVANRGEIACRIIRTARILGVETVAVYSDADYAARHVVEADHAVHIGGAPATESYLNVDAIVSAARDSGADAVHPGYGFLSESPELAEACNAAGIVFVGPSADAMRQLGLKDEAKRIAVAAGVPIVPGYFGSETDTTTLTREANAIGYPLMVKAVAGGGGRGMRVVDTADELSDALESAGREAGASFGEARLMLEKLVHSPRHIEVQVFGDVHGNVVHMFERDCSLQRRHQKVIEEAPAPGMTEALRKKMTQAAVALAAAVGYAGAGTVEFLIEGGTLDDDAPFYFIEMNTRLQVEHPVTEFITGLDLVEWQLRVAAGEELPCGQDEIGMSGHAIEARLYAEDPEQNFQPSIGTLHRFGLPELSSLRVETGLREGDVVSPFYDPMIAKLIGTGKDRTEALSILLKGLAGSVVLGLKTNAAFLSNLLRDPNVQDARMDTGLIGREIGVLTEVGSEHSEAAVRAAALALLSRSNGSVGHPSWDATDSFQMGPPRQGERNVLVDGELRTLALEYGGAHACHACEVAVVDARTAYVWSELRQLEVSLPRLDVGSDTVGAGDGQGRTPITGRVAAINCVAGDVATEGQTLFVVEAMKMEHVVIADREGRIESVNASVGDQVSAGDVVVVMEEIA